MLILVAVTISVALNGGLFNNAKDAKEKTQKATDKEVLLAAATGTIDGKGDLQINVDNMEAQLAGQNWTITDNNNGTLTCKNNDNNKEYLINQTTGKVTEYTGSNSGSGTGGQNQNSGGNEEQNQIGNEQSTGVILTNSQIGQNGSMNRHFIFVNISGIYTESQIQELKNNMTEHPEMNSPYYYFNNIACSDETLTNMSDKNIGDYEDSSDNYYFICYTEMGEVSYLIIEVKKDGEFMTNENCTTDDYFESITFTLPIED